ncbi:MAG: transporter [Gammaproteobacteria bacterium]|nr:transporter [Gammaproteobacteria bacterium]
MVFSNKAGRFLVVCALLLAAQSVVSQELEPRRWTHLPVGANFFGAGYVYSDSDIAFNPALQIEQATGEVHTLALSYVRVLDVFGKSGRIDVLLPYSNGRWEGLLEGEPASTRRDGFNDPRFRFAVNLFGSPAQRGDAFRKYKVNTIVGAAVEVVAPWGDYQKDKLINLGNNRWVIRPQLGVVHNWDHWAVEFTGSVWFYTDNDDFRGSTREQDVLYSGQTHVIYTFKPGLWASLSAAYGGGGESKIDGVRVGDQIGKSLLAASVGFPITRRQGMKIAYIRGETKKDNGSDDDRFLVSYSVMWGGN